MSAVRKPDLHRYQGVILSLVPYSTHKKLDYLIRELAPKANEFFRYHIKLEVRQQAKPCEHLIDLRAFFDGCAKYVYEDVSHYLDEISVALFEDSLKSNNDIYTLSSYLQITSDAKKRHGGVALAQNYKKNLNPDEVFNIPLVNKNILHEIRTDFNSKSKGFIYDPLGMTFNGKNEIGVKANIIELNSKNAIITLPTDTIGLNPEIIYLWLYDHISDIGYDEEVIIAFRVREVKKFPKGGKAVYRLLTHPSKTSGAMLKRFHTYLEHKTLAIRKERIKSALPLYYSINAKIHENFYINTTNSISMLCQRQEQGWFPTSVLKTKGNESLWHFMEGNDNDFHLPSILLNSAFQTKLDNESIDDEIEQYAFILKYHQGDKEHFGIIWYHDFLSTPSVRKHFNSYFLGNDFRFIKVLVKNINPLADAHKLAGIPSSFSPAMALLNMPLTQQVSGKLNNNNRLVIVTGITSVFNDIMSNKKTHGVNGIKLPAGLQLTAVERLPNVEIVHCERDDLRSEDRFDVEFNFIIKVINHKSYSIKGNTNNISGRGLSVKLAKKHRIEAGAEIRLDIAIPYKGKIKTLKNQVYQVVGNQDDDNIRLIIRGTQEKHQACQLIREYQFTQRDSLQMSGHEADKTQGLNKALVNIYSNHHISLPFYISHEKKKAYIRSCSANHNTHLADIYQSNNLALLHKLLLDKKFNNMCIAQLNKVAKHKVHRVFYIILITREHDDETQLWFKSLEGLAGDGMKLAYSKMKAVGVPAILRINMSKAGRLNNKHFIDELNYLSQIDYVGCENLVNNMRLTKGVGEIEDVTKIVTSLLEQEF